MAWTASPSAAFQRPVGNSEYAFIPSSLKDGLGDMCAIHDAEMHSRGRLDADSVLGFFILPSGLQSLV